MGDRAGEIADELGIPRGSVGTTWSRLENRGLVRPQGEYWAIDPKVYDDHTASLIGLRTVADHFDGNDYDQNPDLPDLGEQEEHGKM